MKAFLVHGMARTPASQLLLARRLRAEGMAVRYFAYATFESFDAVVDRFVERVRNEGGDGPFVLIGHSLGCVIIRAALPRLEPRMCFFLAPPSVACLAARSLASNPLYRLITRQMGQRLADDRWMSALPLPGVPVRIYAGTAGPTGRFSPFGDEENDAVLAVSETVMTSPDASLFRVPALHTFIMNSRVVAGDIIANVRRLDGSRRSESA